MIKKIQKTLALISVFFFLLMLPNVLANNGAGNLIDSKSENSNSNIFLLEPNGLPEYLTRTRTQNFIDSTRFVPENNASSLEQIFFKIGNLKILDPALSNLSVNEKNYLISQILSFQNLDYGFGGWKFDTSGLSSTNQATQALGWLGDTSLNKTEVKIYLDSLQNSLTFGFVSNKYDSDSDVYVTSLAVETYKTLGFSPPNELEVIDLLKRGQNINGSIPIEEGGFGLQTNINKSIFWTSQGIVTRAAVFALSDLSSQSINQSLAISFLKSLQTISGGFTNKHDPLDSVTGPYTSSILEGIFHLNSTPTNSSQALNYLLSLENSDGGFKLRSTSTQSSIRGTNYALTGLQLLGSNPTNVSKTINYILQNNLAIDGYGGTPGEDASLRETFDAVASLKLINKTPSNYQSILNYVAFYRNPDGGYGLIESNMDSTSRAVIIYDLLDVPFPNPTETIDFVKSLQETDGGFSKRQSKSISYIISTYRALRILEILQGAPVVLPGVAEFIISTQNADGGFGGFVGDTSDVSTTYRAVRSMSILNNANYDVAGVKQFVLDSQNLDGGFKRSPEEVTLPKNVSNIIHTYSASQIMKILNFQPNNVSAMYDYIVSTRNRDGGFAEHPKFTSNIAYTYTALWTLGNFHHISKFSILIPDNLNSQRTQYNSVEFELNGKLGLMNYTITNINSSSIMKSGVNQLEQKIIIDTSTLAVGSYKMHIEAIDPSLATIDYIITVTIFDTTITSTPTTTTTTPNESDPISPELVILILGLFFGMTILSILVISKRKRKNLL